MAISIDTVYQKVLALANKEQRGYITPQEFNLFADQAQKEIFEQYFYDSNQLTRSQSNSKEYGDIVDNLNEKIAVFETTANIASGVIQANDLYRLGTVIHNNTEVEEVQQNEILYINKSPLTRPTSKRPVYVRVGELNIEIYESDTLINTLAGVTCTYLKNPSKPSWGYVVINGRAMYDSTNKVDFELHNAEENELVYKILKYAGISMKRDNLARGSQDLELLQVQQEKQ